MLDRSMIIGAAIQGAWLSASRDRGAHLGVHYAWVTVVGRFMLNMGVIEAATRLIVASVVGNENSVFSDDLAARISFIRSRFPRQDVDRHSSAMNTLKVARKLTTFRNIIAHSPLSIAKRADGSIHILGILNLTPQNKDEIAEMITLEELTDRVDESALVGRRLLEMQATFRSASS